MEIKATDVKLRVDYKQPGVFYNAKPSIEVEVAIDDATQSVYPFDSVDVEPGTSVQLPPGSTVLRVVEYRPSAQPPSHDIG